MAEVRLDGVTKRFGDTLAVDGLDLDVGTASSSSCSGPPAPARRTTLRLIAGLEQPDQGRIAIGGADVTAEPAGRARRRHGVPAVLALSALHASSTIWPSRCARRCGARARTGSRPGCDEIATLLRIDGKLGNRATRLSGGEMQRVAIGRALVRRPRVYLMDEPLSSLDAKLREDLRIELKRIQRELGATILYVTHDQIEAMTMADRIGVIEQGRLLQLGLAARDLQPARQRRRWPAAWARRRSTCCRWAPCRRRRAGRRRHHGRPARGRQPDGAAASPAPDRAGRASGRRDRRAARARRAPRCTR